MNPYLENAKAFLARLSLGQKLAISLVLVGGIAVLTMIALWAGQPDLALLFGNVDPSDANQVVETLQAENVPYELRENGTAIYVPREDVYELRLRFAGEGLVSDGPLGYELFDEGTLGMTDFMQKLNYKRALEGELARTISSIKQVDVARVHLVIPERSAFRETQAQPSASVVIQLASDAGLSQEQIVGITTLVAGAVEGLDPGGVTVLDARGNMLSNPDAGNEDALISSTQLKYQRSIEQHLTENGQSMLDQIVGPGNSIVRVSATIDFSRRVTEQNLIDPESATVIAEERQDTQQADDQANASIRNYELSRTIERTEQTTGAISYLTVSVILNAKPVQGAEDEAAEDAPPQYVMYPEAELVEIEELVKNAVGFNDARGDQFAIHQTRFDTSVDDKIAQEIREQRRQEQLQHYLRYGLMVLALGLAFWLIRSASRRIAPEGDDVRYLDESLEARAVGEGEGGKAVGRSGELKELEAGDEDDDMVMVDDVFTSKLSPEAKARLKAKHLMYEEIKKSVIEQPTAAVDLLRSWLADDQIPA